MNTPNPLHEISFAYDGARHQAWVRLSPGHAEALQKISKDVQEQSRNAGFLLQNFSLMEVSDHDTGDAESIVETMEHETRDEDMDWKGFMETAQAIDAEAEVSPGYAAYHLVEFVWDNGGGDDNLYGDGFMAIQNSPHLKRFQQYLDQAEELGILYDSSVAPKPPGEESGLQEMIDWSETQPDMAALRDFLKVVLVPKRAEALEEAWPSVPAPRKPGPRF